MSASTAARIFVIPAKKEHIGSPPPASSTKIMDEDVVRVASVKQDDKGGTPGSVELDRPSGKNANGAGEPRNIVDQHEDAGLSAAQASEAGVHGRSHSVRFVDEQPRSSTESTSHPQSRER